MKKLLFLCSIIISILSAINAQEYKGTINDYVPIADDEIELQYQGANIYFYWKLSTLFGEPVVYGTNATTVRSKTSTINVIDIAGRYCISGTSIPSSILKKIRIKSVVLSGLDKKTGGAPSYKIKIDAGIPSQVYIGTYEQLKAAPKETRQKYWSFNVAGSPSWSKLFKHWDGEHLSATQAKQLFKSGIKLKDCGDGTYQSHLAVEWDLSAVKEYLIKLKKVKLDKEFATANKRKKQLTKKEALRNQKEADDFWNTPVSTDTQQDQIDRKTIKRKEEQFANKKQKIASTKKAVTKEKKEVEEYWAAKRNKLNNTPKPGENKGTFVDERDGQEYKWVKIGGQTWMAENLAYDMGNGCWAYDNNEYNADKYGRLYTFEVAKNACPSGWHLPTKREWVELIKYIASNGYSDNEHIALRSNYDWKCKDPIGKDSFGFTALPSGYRNGIKPFNYELLNSNYRFTPRFRSINHNAIWWANEINSQDNIFELGDTFSCFGTVNAVNICVSGSRSVNSVRCIKD